MRPDSAEVAFTKTCEGRDIEVVGTSDIVAFDKVFFDNSQTNLQDLILLGSNSGIIVEFLETELASPTLSSASNTRELEIESNEMTLSYLVDDLEKLLRKACLIDIHDWIRYSPLTSSKKVR